MTSKLLSNIYNLYYHQSLPSDLQDMLKGIDINVIFNPKMIQALYDNSFMNKSQIDNAITNNTGPKVGYNFLDYSEAGTIYGADAVKRPLIDGFTLIETSDVGIENVSDRSGDHKGYFFIDNDLFSTMELALNTSGGSTFQGEKMTDYQRQEAFNAFMATIFHELNHYGVFLTHSLDRTNTKEPGDNFESQAFSKKFQRVSPERE